MLFEPFYSTKPEGVGVLAMVYRIVEARGGPVGVAAHPDFFS